MDLSGLRTITSVNALARPEAGLRLFQRVTAQILDITGTSAVISIDGVPIVAQLSSTDQVALLSQRTAQFVVTQLTDQKVTLKIIQGDQSETTEGNSSPSGVELAIHVLEQHNIPVTDKNLMIARAVLKLHLPITASLMNELINSLENYGTWGSAQAELAAALKVAGLPVTAQSIELASRQPGKITDSITQLIKLINDMAGHSLSAEILRQLEFNLRMLSASVLDGTQEPFKLVEQLKAILEMFGRSQENLLLSFSQNAEIDLPEAGLLSLARLQQMLKQMGRNDTAEVIGKFLEDIRSYQFLNAKSDWLEINIPLQNPTAKQQISSARLLISRENEHKSGKIDPDSTRLILQVDINSNETVEVDLAVMGKQIRTSVTAGDAAWCQQAENELPSLEHAFESLGFILKDAKVSIGEPHPRGGLNMIPDGTPMMAVNIEI